MRRSRLQRSAAHATRVRTCEHHEVDIVPLVALGLQVGRGSKRDERQHRLRAQRWGGWGRFGAAIARGRCAARATAAAGSSWRAWAGARGAGGEPCGCRQLRPSAGAAQRQRMRAHVHDVGRCAQRCRCWRGTRRQGCRLGDRAWRLVRHTGARAAGGRRDCASWAAGRPGACSHLHHAEDDLRGVEARRHGFTMPMGLRPRQTPRSLPRGAALRSGRLRSVMSRSIRFTAMLRQAGAGEQGGGAAAGAHRGRRRGSAERRVRRLPSPRWRGCDVDSARAGLRAARASASHAASSVGCRAAGRPGRGDRSLAGSKPGQRDHIALAAYSLTPVAQGRSGALHASLSDKLASW